MARRASSARRYAEAAFELAGRDRSHDQWARDLALVAEVTSDERVSRVLDDPSVALPQREKVIHGLFDGKVSPGAVNLVRLVAERGRVELLPAIAADFRRLLNQQRNIVEAIVTTAKPLTPDEEDAVRERVESMTGTKVELRQATDPTLIGGLTIRIGDRLLDASVRGRLERLRERLIAQGAVAR